MADHTDRVRTFLRGWQRTMAGVTPRRNNITSVRVSQGFGHDQWATLTFDDLDALCRDAERLREVEDL